MAPLDTRPSSVLRATKPARCPSPSRGSNPQVQAADELRDHILQQRNNHRAPSLQCRQFIASLVQYFFPINMIRQEALRHTVGPLDEQPSELSNSLFGTTHHGSPGAGLAGAGRIQEASHQPEALDFFEIALSSMRNISDPLKPEALCLQEHRLQTDDVGGGYALRRSGTGLSEYTPRTSMPTPRYRGAL